MVILVCSNGQSNLQEKQPSKQGSGAATSSPPGFKDREPPTWRFEKIELEKQIKDWKKRCDDLQEEAKKAPVSSSSVNSETEGRKSAAASDAVSELVSACGLLMLGRLVCSLRCTRSGHTVFRIGSS